MTLNMIPKPIGDDRSDVIYLSLSRNGFNGTPRSQSGEILEGRASLLAGLKA